MDSDPGAQHPQPPPYSGDPLVPPYGDPSASPYGATQPADGGTPPPYGGTPPPYGANPPPYGATPPPYAPPGQIPPFEGQTGAQPFGFPGAAPARGRPDNKMLAIIGGGVAVVVLVIVLIVVLAGGGGSSPTSTVNSFIQAFVSNNGTAVCALVVPAEQSSCTASSFTGVTSGSGQAVNQVIQGDEALVSVTYRVCAGTSCLSNSDPTAGMPGNGVTFDQAFSSALASSTNSLSPAALELVNGTWYIDIGSG